jgi:hypothetical protein
MRITLFQGMVVISIVATALLLATASGEVSIGVRSGDWIEYNVTSSGAPMQGHDVESARMEIISVDGPEVTAKITSNFTDGSSDTITATLNLETGHLIDDFIIPAGLEVGDSFMDENYGSVNITGSETRTYAGAQRIVLTATILGNTYIWDKETGVSLEGYTEAAAYSIHSIVSATNMWHPQTIDLASIVLVIVGVLIIAVLILAGVARCRHHRPEHSPEPAQPSCC